ncbi:hypothetical protein [Planotetraspora sp. GP83]|uniref:hypothetical protein n=1 Tax=Planotetraspora sp. GP83 TaxID=3156264 RepID=UPI003518F433
MTYGNDGNDGPFGIGRAPIDFLAHRQRRGVAGAREEFEQMLGLLVRAVIGVQTYAVEANPGDWGIDILVGDLNGHVNIWQAKYYINGFTGRQHQDVRKSFESALKHAGREGYRIDRWVLCIPRSMDPPSLRWWQRWKSAQEADTKIRIELWDETELRRLLSLPEARHVRADYYDWPRPVERPDAPPVPLPLPTSPDEPWRTGLVLSWRGDDGVPDDYLLHDGVTETYGGDRSWVWREATADRLSRDRERVRLRQIRVLRNTPHAAERHGWLHAQTRLLTDLKGLPDLPRVSAVYGERDGVVVATVQPRGPAWREVFGPPAEPYGTPIPLDRLAAAAALSAAATVCDLLGELHQRGHSHRTLSPDTIVLRDGRHEAAFRDAGLSAIGPEHGEGRGPYQAPEQRRIGPGGPGPGPRTDVYQIAAIVHHTLTGHPPTPGATLPLRAAVPMFPDFLEDLLLRALDPDPRRRPHSVRALAGGLRRGRRVLSQGGRS